MNHETDLSLSEQLQAHRQVEAFLVIMHSRYGIEAEDIPDLIASVRWANAYRNRLDKLSFHAAMTLIGVIVLGGVSLLWAGLKNVISR